MKKIAESALLVIAAVAFVLMCSEGPEGQVTWLNFASLAVFAGLALLWDRFFGKKETFHKHLG